jgi:CheY-like chemotaxis protein
MKIVSKYNSQLTVVNSKPLEIIVNEDNNFDTMELYTDRKRFVQIFDNLISNAVKFTNEGHIKISYQIFTENIVFSISDTGIGISDQEKEQIFNSFSHGANMYVSLHKGLGLGLNITKSLVELLGGKLMFTSDEGKGSTFSLTFPTTDLKNYVLNGNKIKDYRTKINGKLILITEDNNEHFKHIESILYPQNTLIRTQTGQEAVKLLEQGCMPPDIILMEINKPGMDGLSAARIIRKMRPDIHIIAILALGLELQDSDQTYFDGVLTKPISAQFFNKTLQDILV